MTCLCCRLLTGIGIGAVSMAAPLYVAEVAAANRRGPLGTAFQLLVTVGISLAYIIGSVVSWSWLAVTGAALSFMHAILLLIFAPETPRFLLVKSDRQVRNNLFCFICNLNYSLLNVRFNSYSVGPSWNMLRGILCSQG